MPAGSLPAGGDTGAVSLSPPLSTRGTNGLEATVGQHDVSDTESKLVSDLLTPPGAPPQGPVMPTLSRPPSYKLARSAAARAPSQSAAARPPGSLQPMGGDRSQASISLLPGPASASGPGTEGAVWLVCFGRGDPFLAPGGDEWNDMADSYVPPAPARRIWRDVTGKRQIEATVTAVEGPLVATRGGVPGLRLSMFGHIVPDGATDGSWAADGRPASLTIRLSGLRPQARYALHILASGNTTKGGRVEEWFAEGAPGPGGRHWSGGTDGEERTSPLVPTAEGTLTLTFRFGAGYGTSGLNTLGIRETAAGPGAP